MFKLLPFCDKKLLHSITNNPLDVCKKDESELRDKYAVLANHFNNEMKVVGQAFDKGVDIVGQINDSTVLLVQCKNYLTKKITGKDIRECVGITSLYKTTNFQQESLTIIASPSGITEDAIEDMNKFPISLMYVQVSHLHLPAETNLAAEKSSPELLMKLLESGQLTRFVENKKCFRTFGFAKHVSL